MPGWLRYAIGIPLAFFLSLYIDTFLSDLTAYLSCLTNASQCEDLSVAYRFRRTISLPLLFFCVPCLRDIAMGLAPPFLGIVIVTVLLRVGSKNFRRMRMLVTLGAIGYLVSAIYHLAFYTLINQPCGFHMTCFWDGGDLYTIFAPRFIDVLAAGVSGVVGASLLWMVMIPRHEV